MVSFLNSAQNILVPGSTLNAGRDQDKREGNGRGMKREMRQMAGGELREEPWDEEAEEEEDDEELLAWDGNGHVQHNKIRGDGEGKGDVRTRRRGFPRTNPRQIGRIIINQKRKAKEQV